MHAQDGSYNVQYDDGEKEYKVDWTKMKTLVEADQQTTGTSTISTSQTSQGSTRKETGRCFTSLEVPSVSVILSFSSSVSSLCSSQ